MPPPLPVRSIKDLIALAKARPGQLNFSSAGVGNAGHFAGELFKALANAVFAPAATPKEIIGRLNAEILKALAAPEVRERLPGVGGRCRAAAAPRSWAPSSGARSRSSARPCAERA